MAELAKARNMQPYIILYKTRLQLGVRNLPKVFTRQRPGGESNRVSVIRQSDALPVSHRATMKHFFRRSVRGFVAQRRIKLLVIPIPPLQTVDRHLRGTATLVASTVVQCKRDKSLFVSSSCPAIMRRYDNSIRDGLRLSNQRESVASRFVSSRHQH